MKTEAPEREKSDGDIQGQLSDEPSFEGSIATHLYRIAREAVANAQRRGKAEEILLRLYQKNDVLILEIEDDEQGFDLDRREAGLGLCSMRYRAEFLGAELEVESSPGEGTFVQCHLPR